MFSVWMGGWFAGGFWMVDFVLFGWCVIVCCLGLVVFGLGGCCCDLGFGGVGVCRLRSRLLVVLWLLL